MAIKVNKDALAAIAKMEEEHEGHLDEDTVKIVLKADSFSCAELGKNIHDDIVDKMVEKMAEESEKTILKYLGMDVVESKHLPAGVEAMMIPAHWNVSTGGPVEGGPAYVASVQSDGYTFTPEQIAKFKEYLKGSTAQWKHPIVLDTPPATIDDYPDALPPIPNKSCDVCGNPIQGIPPGFEEMQKWKKFPFGMAKPQPQELPCAGCKKKHGYNSINVFTHQKSMYLYNQPPCDVPPNTIPTYATFKNEMCFAEGGTVMFFLWTAKD